MFYVFLDIIDIIILVYVYIACFDTLRSHV